MADDVDLSSLSVTFDPSELGNTEFTPRREYTDEDREVTWGDYGRALNAGVIDIGSQLVGATEFIAGRDMDGVREYLNQAAEEQMKKTSLAFQRRANAAFIPAEGEESVFDVGLGSAILAKGTRSLPSLVASIIPAGIATRAAAGLSVAERAALGAGVAKGTGAILNAGDVANQIYSEVSQLTEEQLMQSPVYAGYISMGMQPDVARQKFMQDVVSYAPLAAAAITYFTGGIEGQIGGRIGGASSKGFFKGIGEGALAESIQETLESGSGAAMTQGQLALNDLGDMDWLNILSQTIEGGVVGAAMGGVGGGAANIGGNRESRRQQVIEKIDEKSPDESQTAALSGSGATTEEAIPTVAQDEASALSYNIPQGRGLGDIADYVDEPGPRFQAPADQESTVDAMARFRNQPTQQDREVPFDSSPASGDVFPPDRDALRQRGFSDQQIAGMTQEEADAILAQNVKPKQAAQGEDLFAQPSRAAQATQDIDAASQKAPLDQVSQPTGQPESDDQLLESARYVVAKNGGATVKELRDALGVGYNRAAALLERINNEDLFSAPKTPEQAPVTEQGNQPSRASKAPQETRTFGSLLKKDKNYGYNIGNFNFAFENSMGKNYLRIRANNGAKIFNTMHGPDKVNVTDIWGVEDPSTVEKRLGNKVGIGDLENNIPVPGLARIFRDFLEGKIETKEALNRIKAEPIESVNETQAPVTEQGNQPSRAAEVLSALPPKAQEVVKKSKSKAKKAEAKPAKTIFEAPVQEEQDEQTQLENNLRSALRGKDKMAVMKAESALRSSMTLDEARAVIARVKDEMTKPEKAKTDVKKLAADFSAAVRSDDSEARATTEAALRGELGANADEIVAAIEKGAKGEKLSAFERQQVAAYLAPKAKPAKTEKAPAAKPAKEETREQELKRLEAEQKEDKKRPFISSNIDPEAGERMQNEVANGAVISDKMGNRTAGGETTDTGRKVKVTEEEKTKAASIAERAEKRAKAQTEAKADAEKRTESQADAKKQSRSREEYNLDREMTKIRDEMKANGLDLPEDRIRKMAESNIEKRRKQREASDAVQPDLIASRRAQGNVSDEIVTQQGGFFGLFDKTDMDESNEAFDKAFTGKSLEEAMRIVGKISKKPGYRAIANQVADRLRFLKSEGMEFTFQLVNPGDMLSSSTVNALYGARGLATTRVDAKNPTSFGTSEVYVKSSLFNENERGNAETVLHEGVHAATVALVRIGQVTPGTELNAKYKELVGLFNEVVKEFNSRVDQMKKGTRPLTDFEQRIYNQNNNAMRDFYELIAWGMTNQEMQTFLRSVKTADKSNAFTAFVRIVRELLGIAESESNALTDLIRITDDILMVDPDSSIAEFRNQHGFGQLTKIAGPGVSNPVMSQSVDIGARGREVLDRVTDRGNLTNAASFGRRIQRATDTMAMVARRAMKFGEQFGHAARRVDELTQRMERVRLKLLKEPNGGYDLVRQGDELQREYGEKFTDAVDIMFRASELNVNLAKQGEVANNGHLGSDAWSGWQGKKQQAALEAKFRALPEELQDWSLNVVKFGRDELNARSLETIKVVLRGAGIEEPGLAERIHQNGVSDEDREKFKSKKIVTHLDNIADMKKLQGWYVPFMRDGDYVVRASRVFDEPTGEGVHKVDDNDFIFVDPKVGSETRARDMAREYLESHGMNPRSLRKVWVNQNNPTEILPAEDVNAVPAYQLSMENDQFELFGSEKEARDRAEEMQNDPAFKNVVTDMLQQNPNARWGGIMPSQYQTVIQSLVHNDHFQGLAEEQKEAVIQAMREVNVRLLPGTRIQKTGLRRKNVAGYSRDLLSSLGRYAEISANYRARLKFQPDIDAALKEMGDYIKERPDGFSIQRREILRDLENRVHDFGTAEANTGFAVVSRRLRQITMLDKLAGVSFHVINALEPSMTAMPMIAGRHGVINATRFLKDAYNMIGARGGVAAGLRDTAKAFSQDVGMTDYLTRFKGEIMSNVGGAEGQRLASVLDYLDEVNLLGDEAGMEMQRITRPSANLLGRGLDRADLMARQVGQAMEAINRSVVGLAAYQAEFQRTGDHQKSLEYARDTVDMTMGNYSQANAPAIFNHPAGALVLQFKKFAQKMYYLLGKLMGDALRGDREAQKQFALLMLTHGLMAGALGLPLEPIKLALVAANLAGVSDSGYDDFEKMVREISAKLFGTTMGEALTRGAPRLIGIDVSSRMSLADLLTFGGPKGNKPEDLKTWLFDTLAGAPVGTVIQQIQGAQELFKGNFGTAAEKMIPLKAARDINQAITRSLEPQTNKFGKETVSEYSPYEAGLRAIGFKSAREAEIGEMRRTVGQDTFDYNTKRQELIRDWTSASEGNRAKQMIAIERFNRGLPKNAQISRDDLRKAEKARKTEKKEGTNVQGLRFTKRTEYLKDEMGIYNTR